jgi:hypothetical protein
MKTVAIALSLLSAVGCSTLAGQTEVRHASHRARETRGAAPVSPDAAYALASGPAVIQHLNTDGQGQLTLYLTDDPGTGYRGCPGASAEDATPVAVLGGHDLITDLGIPAGKRMCAAVNEDGPMHVAWHAQAVEDRLSGGFELATAR